MRSAEAVRQNGLRFGDSFASITAFMPRPDVAEHLPIKPLRLLLGVIACVGIVVILFTLLFGFTTIPANSVGVKTRFGAYHDIVNPGSGLRDSVYR